MRSDLRHLLAAARLALARHRLAAHHPVGDDATTYCVAHPRMVRWPCAAVEAAAADLRAQQEAAVQDTAGQDSAGPDTARERGPDMPERH